MWYYMDPYDSLNKFYRLYLAIVAELVSLVDMTFELKHIIENNLIRVS